MKEKVLVIGGTGFIGFNLLKKLKTNKYDLFSVSTKKPSNNKKLKGVKYIIFDISKKKELIKKLKKYNFAILINLGGNIDHGKKITTTKSHFIGVKNLVDYFNKKKLNLFIQIGSSLEYGDIKSPQKETSPCKPKRYYGLAKYNASNYIINSKHLNFNYLILRLYQVYGPHQDDKRLIPFVIKSCLANKIFDCTDGSQVRNFLYITDLIELLLKIIKSNKIKNGIYNVGNKNSVKVRSIIKIINQIIKKGNPKFGKIKMRTDEIEKLYPNIKKIKSHFKWTSKTNIKDGLIKTILHYAKRPA
tara:strand:- start:695 stop:1600 length:906 start_codon:yes stop_codon:yes gene_type:complete